MKKHIVIMQSIAYVEVCGVDTIQQAMKAAEEVPADQLNIVTQYQPECAFEIGANKKAKTGNKPGRKPTTIRDIPKDFRRMYALYLSKQVNISEMARACEISRPSAHKYIKLLQAAGVKAGDDL